MVLWQPITKVAWIFFYKALCFELPFIMLPLPRDTHLHIACHTTVYLLIKNHHGIIFVCIKRLLFFFCLLLLPVSFFTPQPSHIPVAWIRIRCSHHVILIQISVCATFLPEQEILINARHWDSKWWPIMKKNGKELSHKKIFMIFSREGFIYCSVCQFVIDFRAMLKLSYHNKIPWKVYSFPLWSFV